MNNQIFVGVKNITESKPLPGPIYFDNNLVINWTTKQLKYDATKYSHGKNLIQK